MPNLNPTKAILLFSLFFLSFQSFSQDQLTIDQTHQLNDKFNNFYVGEAQFSSDQWQSLRSPSEFSEINLKIYGQEMTLEVHDAGMYSDKYFHTSFDENGNKVVGTDKPVLLKGKIKGINNSSVRLTLNDGFTYGVVRNGKEEYFIEPLYYYAEGVDRDQFVTYQHKDAVLSTIGDYCAAELRDHKVDEFKHHAEDAQKSVGLCFEVEIAQAADFLMYQAFGSNVFATNNQVNGVLNNVQGNYDDEFADEIKFIIVTNFTATSTGTDPWTTSTAAGTLLNSFRSWGPSGFGITHDVATLWTDRNFDGGTIGIAYLGVICGGSRYNCCENFTGNANLLRVVHAHELGHNFNASHDGSGSGFIMAPSVNSTTTWSNASINSIQNHYLSRTCLSSCPPTGTPPIADFAYTIIDNCAPGEVAFTDISAGSPFNWSWTFTGGTPSTSSDQNPTIFYNTPGTYTVTLEVTSNGGIDTETKTNIIEILPDASAAFTFNVVGSDVLFNSTNSPGTTYVWDFGDANTAFIPNPIHTYAQDGTYEVFLQATNGCGVELLSQFVTIATPPVSGFTADVVEGCDPLLVQFSNAATSNVASYAWTFEGGFPATSTDPNPLVNFDNPGDFDVSLKVTNPQGEDTVAKSDYILVNPSPVASFTGIINGAAVSFTNNSSNANTYAWDFGDGNTSSLVNPLHTYSNAGIYTVSLTATSSLCGDITVTESFEIILQPSASFATSGNTTGCGPFTVDFVDASLNNPTSWLWSFPGGTPASSTDQNPTVVYSTPGLYDVTLEVSNPDGTDTNTLTNYIEVLNETAAAFTYNANALELTFINQSDFGLNSMWDFGDGNTSSDTDPIHTFSQEGIYTVELTSSNNCNNDTESIVIDLYTAPTADFMVLNNSICPGEIISFSNTSSANVTDYAWTFPGGTPATSTEANPTVTYANDGVYDVSLIASNPSFQDQISITAAVNVNAEPIADFTTQSDQLIYSFINLSQNANTYLWDFGDGNTATDMEPVHTYAGEGDYQVVLTATGPCGTVSHEVTVTVSTKPSANFMSSTQLACIGDLIDFSNLSSSNAQSFEWTFEGGSPSTSSDENPQVSFSERGTYDVSLLISGAGGTDEIILSDYITIIGDPEGDFSSSVTGATAMFNSSFDVVSSYLWDFGDGVTSIEENPSHLFSANATYVVNLTVTNQCGTTTIEKEITIDSYPTATFSLGVTTVGCSPFSLSITNNSSQATDYLWTLTGPETLTSTDESPTFELTMPGLYSIVLNASNTLGMEETTMIDVIEVLSQPIASFTTQSNATEISFTNTSLYADSYLWDFGDGNTDTDENPIHTYNTEGVYTVTLTATGDCGQVTITEMVSAITTTPIIDFNLSSTTGCIPYTLDVTDMTGNDPTDWLWEFEGGTPATSTEQSPSVTYNSAGTFDIKVTVTNASGTSSVLRDDIIVVEDVPTVDFSSNVTNGIVDFTNNSSSGDVMWNFGDGNVSTENDPTHVYDGLGFYTVTLTVTNACGENELTQEVEVDNLSATTKVLSDEVVNIFPNPTNGLVNIEGLEAFEDEINILIVDALGRQVSSRNINRSVEENYTMDLSEFDNQLLFIKFSDSTKYSTKRVLLIR